MKKLNQMAAKTKNKINITSSAWRVKKTLIPINLSSSQSCVSDKLHPFLASYLIEDNNPVRFPVYSFISKDF